MLLLRIDIAVHAFYLIVYFRFRSLVNLMKNNSHLMEVDALFVRSCMFLIPLDDLMECNLIDIELLDMLHVFTNKAPPDITSSNYQVKWNI